MDDTPRDADGNRTDLRPVELLERAPRSQVLHEVFGLPPLPHTPEVHGGMMDEELRRRVDRANVQVADHQAGRRAIPDTVGAKLVGLAMLRDVEGLEVRAGELDRVLGEPGERQEGDMDRIVKDVRAMDEAVARREVDRRLSEEARAEEQPQSVPSPFSVEPDWVPPPSREVVYSKLDDPTSFVPSAFGDPGSRTYVPPSLREAERHRRARAGAEVVPGVGGGMGSTGGRHAYDLDNIFTYHPPIGDQPQRYRELREKAKEYAELALKLVPASAERTLGLRRIEEATMWLNAAIARNEGPLPEEG